MAKIAVANNGWTWEYYQQWLHAVTNNTPTISKKYFSTKKI